MLYEVSTQHSRFLCPALVSVKDDEQQDECATFDAYSSCTLCVVLASSFPRVGFPGSGWGQTSCARGCGCGQLLASCFRLRESETAVEAIAERLNSNSSKNSGSEHVIWQNNVLRRTVWQRVSLLSFGCRTHNSHMCCAWGEPGSPSQGGWHC